MYTLTATTVYFIHPRWKLNGTSCACSQGILGLNLCSQSILGYMQWHQLFSFAGHFRVDSLFTEHPGAKEVTALTPTTCSCLQSLLGFCGTLQVPGRRAPEQPGSVQTEVAARGAKQLVFQQFPELRRGPATRQTARPLCQPGQVHPEIWHTRVSCGT